MKLFALATIIASMAASIVLADKPTLYVFGDSLSDIGTLKELTLGIVPPEPYWNGRFSSGPMWNEYLHLLLDYNLYNKALGGSTSDNDHAALIDVLGIKIPSTQDQINFFKFVHPFYELDSTRDDDIAVLEVGHNDFFSDEDALAAGNMSISNFNNLLSATVMDQVDQLRKIGFHNILVSNLATIQYTPMARKNGQGKMIAEAINKYNALLEGLGNDWYKGVKGDVKMFSVVDIGDFVKVTINSPAIIKALGIKNTIDPCLDMKNSVSSLKGLLALILGAGKNHLCPDPSVNYFFDDVHPAERIHRLFGYSSFELIKSLRSGTDFKLNEETILKIIRQYNLGTPAPHPAKI